MERPSNEIILSGEAADQVVESISGKSTLAAGETKVLPMAGIENGKYINVYALEPLTITTAATIVSDVVDNSGLFLDYGAISITNNGSVSATVDWLLVGTSTYVPPPEDYL